MSSTRPPVSLASLRSFAGSEGQSDLRNLQRLLDSGTFSSEEVALAGRIASIGGASDLPTLLMISLLLRSERMGSSMVDLDRDINSLLGDDRTTSLRKPAPSEVDLPSSQELIAAAKAQTKLFSTLALSDSTTTPRTPFVVSGAKVFTNRAWMAETEIASKLGTLHASRSAPPKGDEWREIEQAVLSLIRGNGSEAQRRAASAGARTGGIEIITGGPGTGKTFTVRALVTVAWLQRLYTKQTTKLFKVALAAPTGKAAQRMREAMSSGLESWCRDIESNLQSAGLLPVFNSDPDNPRIAAELNAFLSDLSTSTIHRLLGVQFANRTRFNQNDQNPLIADLLIIDEASMIDLPLMASLMKAIQPPTKLILVGDQRQLASVGTGTILADLCTWGRRHEGSLIQLSISRRFPESSAIGKFAKASEALDEFDKGGSSEGDVAAKAAGLKRALNELKVAGDDDEVKVRWALDTRATKSAASGDMYPALDRELKRVSEYWYRVAAAMRQTSFVRDESGRLYFKDEAAKAPILNEFPEHAPLLDSHGMALSAELVNALANSYRALSAHRSGELGVSGLNMNIINRVASKLGLRPNPRQIGSPLIVTKNDPAGGRFNGDVGLWALVSGSGEQAQRMAIFPDAEGGAVAVSATLLPEHQPVYAMTVHKSQGSEFLDVLFVLPSGKSPIWTRELVYTGVTRVKKSIVLAGSEEVFVSGLSKAVERATGLAERLSGAA